MTLSAMAQEVVDIARAADGNPVHEGTLILPEANLADGRSPTAPNIDAEALVSKIFKLHRRGSFHEFICAPDVVAILEEIHEGAVDCFLTQYIFKNPGAWGQPWHQDSYYFPFDRTPQVGLWLAISEATLENGCLHVVPGSHTQPVHDHVDDRRPNANIGYVEIIDHDMSESISVTMEPGDLLVFHSHLMHCSTDNESDDVREAMVFHAAARGTTDSSGQPTLVNDWMPLEAESGAST
jgi:ectoine hydroxylase-related dioxygenase (phytanoyl-CoA dioxygenase family)